VQRDFVGSRFVSYSDFTTWIFWVQYLHPKMMLRKVSTTILQRNQPTTTVGSLHFHPKLYVSSNDGRLVVTRRNISNAGHDWKEKMSDLFERTSSQASELAKKHTGQTLENLDVQRKKAFDVISSKAHKTSETLTNEAQKAYERGSTSAKEMIRKTSQEATSKIHSTVSDASQVMNETTKVASERIRTSTFDVVSQARIVGTKTIRWAALWSLAAIFVYGVATSIPSAVIRHLSSPKKDDDDIKTQEPSRA